MGDFKPLIDLGGEPLIRRTVRSALAGGAQEVRVVVGREEERVRAALGNLPDVVFVENPLYASSDMFFSIQLALRDPGVTDGRALRDAILGKPKGPLECLRTRLSGHEPDALFILPGDAPAIAPETFELLTRRATDPTSPPLLRPSYQGKHGHPLLVRQEAYRAIRDFDAASAGVDAGGLKAALASFDLEDVEVSDAGVMLDADTPDDLKRLKEYLGA
jgi:CTP:molybdopterin cytidylyltransferase MocA